MLFIKHDPPVHLAHIVRQFWIVENPDSAILQQKIVPDGFGEIIFHYGDPFRIRMYDTWEEQARMLISGQIRRYFYLENTGASAMLGIKLMPAAVYALFKHDMSTLTDKVLPLSSVTDSLPPSSILQPDLDPEKRILIALSWLETLITHSTFTEVRRIAEVADRMIAKKGLINMESQASEAGISRRHLEREFKKVIGLTPKYFARVVQFSNIFEAMQARDNAWVDIALNSGYFDQSHFIRNFKAFTGESPSQYGFDQQNLANFFLRRD